MFLFQILLFYIPIHLGSFLSLFLFHPLFYDFDQTK